MKKLLAALLAAILAGSGLSIVDKELTDRVDVLEKQNIEQTSQIDVLNKKIDELTSQVNEIQKQTPQDEKEYKIGDIINISYDPFYHYYIDNNKKVLITDLFDELNITAKIVDICTDSTNSDYYKNKYTIEFVISGKVSQKFFDICAWSYFKPIDGYACNFNITNDGGEGCIVLDFKDKSTNTFSVTEKVKLNSANKSLISISEYVV